MLMTVKAGTMLIGGGGPAPFPVFRSVSSNWVAGGGGSQNTVSKPSGVVAGDTLVAVGTIENPRTLSSPSWTIAVSDGSDEPGLGVLYKIAGGGEPSSYTFTWDSAGANIICILAYIGGSGTAAGTVAFNNGNTLAAPSITPAVEGVLLAAFGRRNGGNTITPPSGMTERFFYNANTPSLAVYELTPSPAGATGTKSVTWGGPSRDNSAALVQISA